MDRLQRLRSGLQQHSQRNQLSLRFLLLLRRLLRHQDNLAGGQIFQNQHLLHKPSLAMPLFRSIPRKSSSRRRPFRSIMTRVRCSSGLSTINPASRCCDRSQYTITGIAWYQPLGIPAPVAQAKPGNTFSLDQYNRNVFSIRLVSASWQSCSGCTGAAGQYVRSAQYPAGQQHYGNGLVQHLSRSAPVAIAQAGFSFVPFNTKQVVTVQVAFDPFVKKKHASKRRRLEDDLLRQELEIKYKRRLAIEEAFWPPTTYELPPYKLPEHVKPAPDVSDLANVIMQVQQMRAAQAKQQDEEDEKALLELLKREYGIEDV